MIRLLIAGLLVFTFIFGSSGSVLATTEAEMRQQIDSTNKQISDLDKEIKKYQNQIAETSDQAKTLANFIKELTLSRIKLVTERSQIEKKIKATGLVINSLALNITVQEKSIDSSKDSLKKALQNIYKLDNTLFIETLLAKENFVEVSREYNNILALNEKLKEHVVEIKTEKDQLVESKTEKENEQRNLNNLKSDLNQKELAVLLAKKEKDSLLSATKSKEATYQKILAEQIKKRDAFESALEDYEAQLKFILNPKSIPKEGTSVLAWPLNTITITSPYGARWGRFHYGLDFRATIGTSVKAMAEGVVEGTGNTDTACKGASFGKWVFIRYNNGLSSTYGHLSAISANVGQKVKSGDVVALSGNTGSSTGPHLHVAVYASDGVKVDTVPSKSCGGKIFTQPISALTAYLNPSLYLPPATLSMYKK